MTTYELAQTMVRLGAVTAAALEPGKAVTAAFQGQVLNRPSGKAGELPVKEALLVQYLGVYAPPPSAPQLGRNNQAAGQQLAYTVVRPSTVTAELVAPDGTTRPIDSGTAPAGDVPLRLDGVRRRGHVALARVGDRRPEPAVDRRAAVPGRLHAVRAEGAEASPGR